MDHPDPKEVTVFFSEVGKCPECGFQFEFSPFGQYDGAFANTEHMIVAILQCKNGNCRYTMPFHIMLQPDDEPPDETDPHPEYERAKAQALQAGVSPKEWKNNKLNSAFDDDLPF